MLDEKDNELEVLEIDDTKNIDNLEDLENDKLSIEEIPEEVTIEFDATKKIEKDYLDNEDKEEKKDSVEKSSKKIWIIIGIISLLMIIIIVVSCVLFNNKPKEVKYNTETGGSVLLSYTDSSNILSIKNAKPMTDEVAIADLKGDNYFEFSVETEIENANNVSYEIAIDKIDKDCTIPDDDIKIYLEKEDSGTYVPVSEPQSFIEIGKKDSFGVKKDEMVLNKVTNKSDKTENYRLKLWLSNNALKNNNVKDYSVKIKLYGNAK